MEIKTIEGFIISEKPYKESSKIISVITKEYGIISLIAKGAKRLKSNLRSATDIFTYANFEVNYKEDSLCNLIAVTPINSLSNIKKDIEKISYVNFISELAKQVIKQSNNKNIYNILIDSIIKINDGFDPMVITNILELKYLDFLGVSPVFDRCALCDSVNVVTLSSIKGGFVCKKHMDNDYLVNEKTIKIIRMLKYVDISKISKLDISYEVKKEINDFINDYYDSYTGLYLKSKDFLKNIVKLK